MGEGHCDDADVGDDGCTKWTNCRLRQGIKNKVSSEVIDGAEDFPEVIAVAFTWPRERVWRRSIENGEGVSLVVERERIDFDLGEIGR